MCEKIMFQYFKKMKSGYCIALVYRRLSSIIKNIHTKEKHSRPQFFKRRIYTHVNYDRLSEQLNENKNTCIQSIFSSQCPDFIANVLLEEINKAVKNLVIIEKIQCVWCVFLCEIRLWICESYLLWLRKLSKGRFHGDAIRVRKILRFHVWKSI